MKKTEIGDFVRAGSEKKHRLVLLNLYNGDDLATRIAADYDSFTVCAENFTSSWLWTAFGNNTDPSWEDYLYFLEDRCVPRTRDGLRYYLEALGLDSYEPLEIIKKTQGRMAEDHMWLTVEEIR